MTKDGRDYQCITIFVEKPGGKRPLNRPASGWKDNIKITVAECCYDESFIKTENVLIS
jgi:hypothetical protein